MNFKKKAIILIAALALLSASACKKEEETVKTPESNNVVEEVTNSDEYYEDGLSTERYDGYNFRMLLRKGMVGDQYQETDSDDVINSATYRRNKTVEEKYGITITASESSDGNYETDALNSILAGDDAYDLIFAHSRAAFTYAVQGAALNINDISTIHTDKPWWNKDVQDSCNINGHQYVLDGDISRQGLGSAMVLFFNKRIFDELGYEYPYETVKDGEWTFDEFAYYARKGAADLNGDGVMKLEDDRFGFVSGTWMAPINILYAGGGKVYDKNDEGRIELTLFSNKTVDLFSEFFSLMDTAGCEIIPDEYDGPAIYTAGRAMFSTSTMDTAIAYRSMDDDFGILPYPKFDENDDYATVINGIAHLAVIPITVSDAERTGAITEALCAYGSKYVIPAFYETTLKTKTARDDDSEEMMDIVKESIIYDIGYVAGGPFQSIGRSLALADSHDFASYYAKNESKALDYLVTFNADYGHLE